MAKRAGIFVEQEGWMTVSAYEKMLRGQYQDALDTLFVYDQKGQLWSVESVQYASFALPDGPAFDIEVVEAWKQGHISERSWLRLSNIAEAVWMEFAALIKAETGQTLADFDCETNYWNCEARCITA